MGVDVFGNDPIHKDGGHFCNNWWWWRPLAVYCCEVAPQLTKDHCRWFENSGYGLDPEDSNLLADALQSEIDSGRCAKHAETYKQLREASPTQPCKRCAGTGVQGDALTAHTSSPHTSELHVSQTEAHKCDVCDGSGRVLPLEAAYDFSVENVAEFVKFLRACGGFEIC